MTRNSSSFTLWEGHTQTAMPAGQGQFAVPVQESCLPTKTKELTTSEKQNTLELLQCITYNDQFSTKNDSTCKEIGKCDPQSGCGGREAGSDTDSEWTHMSSTGLWELGVVVFFNSKKAIINIF